MCSAGGNEKCASVVLIVQQLQYWEDVSHFLRLFSVDAIQIATDSFDSHDLLWNRQAASCCVLLTKYHLGDKVKKTEMGRSCSMYGGEQMFILGFSGET
jgi:hypothetical protein